MCVRLCLCCLYAISLAVFFFVSLFLCVTEFKCATISLCLFVYTGVCASVRLHVNVCGDYGGMLVLKGFCPRMAIMDGERETSQMAGRGGDDLHNNQQEKNEIDTHGGGVCVCVCVSVCVSVCSLFSG